MPDVEAIRKQAKRYLRWHRDGYYPVAVQIRMYLHRYRGLSDEAVMAADFKLADAQELMARRSGFDSWSALIQGADAMSKPTQPTDGDVEIVAAEPQLFVSDMETACAFYVSKLGFVLVFSYGEPPFYAQVARGGARLNLRRVDGPVYDAETRGNEPDLLSASVRVNDAKPLFLEYQQAGADFHQTLRTEPWGARTFIVRDPDGNLIAFAGRGT
ncbi:MAG: bleomycin resistance family protein [Rhodospirillaceae bacterium]|nr:bleomycin resistance family protein [Rhodospirillaceae bacterium]|tara:strand:- start:281 stop:922 length:642 start_codon:yes stop_codon:yes gene_type:complete